MTLHVDDVARGRVAVPIQPGRALRIAIETCEDVDMTARRAIHADVIRRVAERRGAVVSVFVAGDAAAPDPHELTRWGCRPTDDAAGRAHVAVGDDSKIADITVRPPDADLPLPSGAAMRLAVLCREPDAARAALLLDRWQQDVAHWAEHPSKPMCADYVAWCDEALDDNLDIPRVVDLMLEVGEHPQLPPGSKFETYAALDRVLGADLTARVGLPR